jgi:hypothetical protein
MTISFLDVCRFSPVAGGTGSWVYSAPVQGYQSPTLAGAVNGATYRYRAESSDLTQWEVGYGVYTASTTTLTRATVLSNSSGTGTATGQSGAGSLINFSTAPQVGMVLLAEDISTFLINANNLSDVSTPATALNNLSGISYGASQSLTALQQTQAQKNAGLPAIMRSYLAGLTLSTAGSSATFGVAAGVAADSTNAGIMTLGSAYTKTTSAWALGTGNGALDTGSIAANTWYHAYLIQRTDTGVVDLLVSLSASAPTMPSGYTLFRRIGSMKTDGSSHWLQFVQFGDEFLWSAPIQELNGAATPITPSLFTLGGVPAGVQVQARVRGYILSSSGLVVVMFQSPDEASAAVNSPYGNADMVATSTGTYSSANLIIRTSTSGQVRWIANSVSANAYMVTYGWFDSRGKLN